MRRTIVCLLVLGLMLTGNQAFAAEDRRVEQQLAVQSALDTANEHLKRGNFRDAVQVLEKHLAYIDGNRRYLLTLRDAYMGYISQLQQAGKDAEVSRYRDRLSILAPVAASRASIPASDTSALTPPVADKPVAVPAQRVNEPKMVALGKSNLDERGERDPFSISNRADASPSDELVAQADRAFAAKNYAEAWRLYEEAEEANPGCARNSSEQRAYCKLYRVACTISGEGIPIGDELEQEIEEAVRLCPTKMKTFADQLKMKMRECVAEVTIRHAPRQGQGWALAETANFRVFHATSVEVAEKACRLAEATRAAMARKWLSTTLPNWTPRCDIYLHPTIKGYKLAGGQDGAPGHSSVSLRDSQVTMRRVDLRMDDPNIFVSTLPHETTHIVLAGQFGKHHLPRWADEGIAVLSECRERVGLHVRNLPAFRREGKLFRVETLLKLEDYPDASRVPPFYAQSVSLCEFLASRKSPATLAAFVRDGLEQGYEAALKTHYGLESFAQLEEEWLQHAFGGSQTRLKTGMTRR
jgi:tetratricopeptide (TPR) repeat protein